ncbi:MAG TPA: OmpA family protein [Polyangiaceae bacterium]|jgi:outer membrane protein OmpA-like peptidoglycan-associated protein|nr:OmpA family protein [Polyangiaceae bacterium]
MSDTDQEERRLSRAQLKKGVKLPAGKTFRLQLVGEVECLRLLGLFFDTNKAFILPGTLDLLKQAKAQYERHPDGEVVLFGHTDTTGEPDINDPLSQKRADMVAAYLMDYVPSWLEMFDSSVPSAQRWGEHEDFLMLSRMKGFEQRPSEISPTTWFQRENGLKDDGIMGPKTREKLIKLYMAVDDTTLPTSTALTAIGCGEDFPLDDSTSQMDAAAPNDKEDSLDRRVELFFVHAPDSDIPPKTREAYPEWLKRSVSINVADGGSSIRVIRLKLVQGGNPLSGKEFLLSSPKAVLAGGKLGPDGLLQAVIPSGVGEVTVEVREVGLRRILTVRDTPFPAADTVRGAQLRLLQLGYFRAEVDGKASDVFDDALAAFRSDQNLEGARDLDVFARLLEVYGS